MRLSLLRSFSRRRLLALATLALPVAAAQFVPARTDACSPPVAWTVGLVPGCAIPPCADVPRNAVFFTPTVRVDTVDVTLQAVPGEAFFEAAQLFDVGAQFDFSGVAVTVVDVVDTTQPATPTVLAADFVPGGSPGGPCERRRSCGGPSPDSTTVTLDGVSDDFAANTALTYEVFVGDSAAEALVARVPAVRSAAPFDAPTVTIAATGRRRQFVAVEVLDQAGNRSERTEAIEVR